MMRPRIQTYLALATILMLCSTSPVLAQVIEEVVVTAQKRKQNLQDVPISMSAVSNAMIEKHGMEGFRDWAEYVPGITMFHSQDVNRRTGPTATIRGVTHASQGHLFEGTSTATSSFTIGQVPFFSGDPGLYDLNRVEVLRGPQGTLHGIASMGGTVRFIPNEAQTDEFTAAVGTGYGFINDGGNSYDAEFMVNVPLVEDALAIRWAAKHRHSDGWIDQYFPGLSETGLIVVDRTGMHDVRTLDVDNTEKDANTSTTTGGRISVTYTPNDRFTFKAFSTWQKSDQDNQQWTDVNDSRDEPVITRYALQPQRDEFTVSSIEASYDLGLGSLEFIGGYYQSENSEALDFTRQAATLFMNGAVTALDADGPGGLPPDPFPARATIPFATNSSIYSGELRLQGQNKSLIGSGLTFDYIFGGFYQYETRDGKFMIAIPNWNANRGPNTVPILTEGGLILASEGESEYDNKAAFADITLHLTEKLSVGAGIRYFDQQRDSRGASFGDVQSGRAANGATVGDNLTDGGTRGTPATVAEDGVTPRATVSYRYNDDKMIYFTAAQGKRIAQGFPDRNFLQTSFSPDTRQTCIGLVESLGILDDAIEGTVSDSVLSYDLGIKSYWMDRRLLLNAAVYYLEWTDFQLQYQLNQFIPFCTRQIAANVGEVESKGFELEMVYAPSESWVINTAISYTDLAFSSVPDGVVSSIPGVNLKEGDRSRSVAPWTAAVGVEYRFNVPPVLSKELSGYIRADWRYVAERMNNVGDEGLLRVDPTRSKFFADSYNLTDVRIGVESDDWWSISLYASNLFDQEAMYACEEGNRNPNLRVCGTNQPRTIGFSIRRHF